MKVFITHEILTIYGVFLAITLGSAAQLHLALISHEEKINRAHFTRTRSAIRNACFWLCSIFCIALISVILKPLLTEFLWAQVMINALNIWLLFVNVLIMWDMTRAAFGIRAVVTPPGNAEGAS